MNSSQLFPWRVLACLACILFSAPVANAVINPALQPDVYFGNYDNVVVLEVQAIDAEAGQLKCAVVKSIKGTYTAEQAVSIVFAGALSPLVGERQSDGSLVVGDQFPVFAGKPSRRKSNRQVRMYADEFYVGEVKEVGLWQVGLSEEAETDSEGKTVNTLAGIYCGMTSELIRLVEDMAADRDFYPRKAYVKFQPDVMIDQLSGSIEGLALYDLNGDGLDDIVACSVEGDRVYFQMEPMVFTNVTEQLGITSKSESCSVADVDCDGLADVLLGCTLYRGDFTNNQFRLVATDWLPVGTVDGFISASFVELNGDGYPDVVLSAAGGGLRAFLNGGVESKTFVEHTQAVALDQEACGAGGNGYFFPGDWNGDRRTDLFYAHGKGYLLVQNEVGQFIPVAHDVDFSFKTGLDEYGKTGAGVFMTTHRTDAMDIVLPIEKDWLIVSNRSGEPEDITMWGNEISEGSDYHLATVTADLNVDGYMDIYTITEQQKENRYIINRGYGSYMHAKVHVDEKPLFKGPAHASGGRSVAVGDINDDGAPDVLIGNELGQLLLIQNDTLSMRAEAELMTKDEKRLMNVRLCSVRVLGPRGVVGAQVRLFDASDRVVIRQDLAGNVATGCRSPDAVCFAVRQPGKYRLNVIYADGYTRDYAVDLSSELRVSIVAQRADGEDEDGW